MTSADPLVAQDAPSVDSRFSGDLDLGELEKVERVKVDRRKMEDLLYGKSRLYLRGCEFSRKFCAELESGPSGERESGLQGSRSLAVRVARVGPSGEACSGSDTA